MRWILAYLAVGLFLTFAWNTQVQSVCGKPMAFEGLVLAPIFLPIFAPSILWNGSTPKCEKMNLAMTSTQEKSP
jgi:hypothetical protein